MRAPQTRSLVVGGGRFAVFHLASCYCGVRGYTAIVEHGEACCHDDLRRAARLVTLRVISVTWVMRGFIWRDRLLLAGFESAVAEWFGIHRSNGC